MIIDLEKELADMLSEYADGVTDGVKEAVSTVGKETVKALRTTSPKRRKNGGKYAKGWRVKNTREDSQEKVVTVHNATDYQLTHLLENGHANRDGTFTPAHKHIKPAEEAAARSLEEKVRIVIKGGK